MSDQLDLYPSGLTHTQFDRLSTCANKATDFRPQHLLQKVRYHLDRTRTAYASNRLVNVRLASAMCDSFTEVVKRWESLTPNAQTWLADADIRDRCERYVAATRAREHLLVTVAEA